LITRSPGARPSDGRGTGPPDEADKVGTLQDAAHQSGVGVLETNARSSGANPLNQLRLKGRVDEDITDLILLYERGERLPQDLNPSVLDRFEEAKAGPLTGAAPSDVN